MPLLEREPLVNSLRSRLADARGGLGSLVLVTGEAGIGKTALVDAFVADLPRGTRWLRGACDPVVPARPFAPISDMAGQLKRRPPGGACQRGSRSRHQPVPGVLRELGSGSVVVFEDLHWADSATLDLLRVVGRRLTTTPVLIIGTARGQELDEAASASPGAGRDPAGVDHGPARATADPFGGWSLAAGTGIVPRTCIGRRAATRSS